MCQMCDDDFSFCTEIVYLLRHAILLYNQLYAEEEREEGGGEERTEKHGMQN